MKRIYTDIHYYTDDKLKIAHTEAFLMLVRKYIFE